MQNLILNQRKFKTELVNLINKYTFPAFMLKPIIKELLEQIEKIEEQQYQEALKMEQENKQIKESKGEK